jgi:predicted dehydrogenase
VPEIHVVAVAARDEGRARSFAGRFGIPNTLHAAWTVRALEAGKHVLCEKPLASNALEAAQVAAATERAERVLMEGLHWRYHQLATRMREVIDSAVIGRVHHVDVTLATMRFHPGDIRYRLDLGGGATMDLGCYAVDMLRLLTGAEPEVVAATARLAPRGVDRWMRADLRFSDGRTARLTCALLSGVLFRREIRVRGDAGHMRVINPVAPHLFNRLHVRAIGARSSERVIGESSYASQLRAFVRAVFDSTPVPTDAANGLANMAVLDAIYHAAGLPLRGR